MKTLLKTSFTKILAACLLAVSLFSGAVQAAEPKPVLTISISSYLSVLEAGKAIANQIGQGDVYGMFQALFGALPGVDNTKPLGFVLFATEEEFLPVVFLPVTDLKKFTDAYPIVDSYLSEQMDEVGPGKYSLSGPIELILEQKKNWLILYPESYPKLAVDDPSTYLDGLNKKYLLALHVNFENAPKELILQTISGVEMLMSIMNPDAAQQFATVKESVELLLDEGKWLLEGLNIDTKTADITGEVAMEVKPTGIFAEALKYQKDGKTNFIGFFRPEQAMAAVGIGLIPDAQKETQINQIKGYFASAAEGVEYELEGDELEFVQGIIESVEEIVVATIEAGKTDGAISLKSTGEIFFGGRVAKGNLLGDVFKKTAAGISEAAPETKSLFKLEYTSFEGYKFSSLALPFNVISSLAPNAADLPEHLEGKSVNLLLGVKDDAVCGVIGTDASKLETILKKCITDSKTPAALPKTSFVFSLPLTAGAMESLGFLPPEPPVVAVQEVLKNAPKDATITAEDDITISSQSVKNVIKVNISGKIIAAIAKAVTAGNEAQMQSALNSDPFEDSPKTQNRERTRDFNF